MTNSKPHPVDLDVKARRRKERKIWRNALLASLLLHACVFLVWGHRAAPLSPFAAAGPLAGDDRAAPGSMQAMNVRTPPSRPVVPPPIPEPTLDDVEPVEFDEESALDEPAIAGAGVMGLEGPGIEEGTGEGDAGTAAEGLNRMTPPSPRGMIIPPMNDELRDRQIQIWVFVDERGRVVPDSTHLRPPTSDRRYNERLIEQAAEWLFTPAQRAGQPVATWFPYTIS